MQPTNKNRNKAIGSAIFGILLIAVVVYKFVIETKKVSDTKEKLSSLNQLPKETSNTSTSSENPAVASDPIRVVRDEIFLLAMIDDANARLEVYPSFTIFNAKNVPCHARIYFYDDEGNHLRTENRSEYTDSDGSIQTSLDFQPKEDQVKYSSGHSDLVLRIPYSRLYLSPEVNHVQYELLLYDNNGNILDKSERLSCKLKQD